MFIVADLVSLTLLQELKGMLYFEDSSDSNCVNSNFLLNFIYLFLLVNYFLIYKYKSRYLATYIVTTWPLQIYVFIVYKTQILYFSTSAKP